MDTEKYCKNLDKLDPEQAIRAIHEAFLQLDSIGVIAVVESKDGQVYDNRSVLESLKKCLESAGHLGFN